MEFTAVFTLNQQNQLILREIQAVARFTDQFLRNVFEQFFALRPNIRRLISIDTVMLTFQTDVPIDPRDVGIAPNTTLTIDFKTTGRATGVVPRVNAWLALIEGALESPIYLGQLTDKFETTAFGTTKTVVVTYVPQPTPAPGVAFSQVSPVAVDYTGPSANVEPAPAPPI
jgi:hypothetical protein